MINLTQQERRAIYLEEKAKEENLKKAKEEDRKEYKNMVDETVKEVFFQLKEKGQEISILKKEILSKFSELKEIKKDVHQNKKDKIESQLSHCFTTKDSKYSVQIGQNMLDGWDDTVTEGISKVKQFIESLAKDEDSRKLVNTILKLLSRDKQGNLKIKNLYELEDLAQDYESELFKDGVNIIRKSYKPTPSSTWIKAWNKDNNGEKKYLPSSYTEA